MATAWPRLGVGAFARYEALGNDYLIIDDETFGHDLSAGALCRLCDRHTGVGSDGVLIYTGRNDRGAHGLRIVNPDGSEAEKSGNGLRIFARFLCDFGYIGAPGHADVRMATPVGEVAATVRTVGGEVQMGVDMGRARFGAAAVGAVDADSAAAASASMAAAGSPEASAAPLVLQLRDRRVDVTCVSVGNPHAVVFVDALDEESLHALGPQLEHHARFPHRINVQFARLRGRRRLDILIWERGAGATRASGSSSCAAAAAAVRHGAMDAGVWLDVHMPGGVLAVRVAKDFSVAQKGPAVPICRGTLLFGGPTRVS